MSVPYIIFCGICITVLKELNTIVDEPYMDEPFHVPQAQAYCRGELTTWDPKITTPPGLYLFSLLLKKVFLFKCTLPMLRLTSTLTLLVLPLVITRLLCIYKRQRPPASVLAPLPEALVLSAFPLAWFYGFLYYTEVPSVVSVIGCVAAALQGWHWCAALIGLVSCTFRQTNVVWVLYAYVASQLLELKYRRVPSSLHDPPALVAGPGDLFRSLLSAPRVLGDVLPAFVPYSVVLAAFAGFVVWNGGIVLGDKSHHIPSLHVPQLYYFVSAATFFGWPVLVSGPEGVMGLMHEVRYRMFGTKVRGFVSGVVCVVMGVTVKLFTIQHPFLLSDNRHYTFYVWRRLYLFHPIVPYVLVPIYLSCGWAWYLRVGRGQTLLETMLVPIFVIPTVLPTPLIEPRYFVVPYILLRSQIREGGCVVECVWYVVVNCVSMGVFLYFPRDGVGRFMW